MEVRNNGGGGAQEPNARRRAFDVKNILFYGLVAMTLMNFVGSMHQKAQDSKNPLDTGGNETEPTPHAKSSPVAKATTANRVSRRVIPLAQPNDDFNLRIAVDHDLFEPIEFSHLQYDAQYLNNLGLKKMVHMDLASCAASNCSASVHVFWTIRGKTFNTSSPLIRFYKTKVVEKHRLVGGNTANQEDEKVHAKNGEEVYKAYVLPYVAINPVVDFTTPLPVQFEAFTPVDEDTLQYGPAVYINDFWIIRDSLRELNATTASEPFSAAVTISPLPVWKLVMYQNFEASMKSQIDMGLSSDDLGDETKRIFLETNPYFLALTGLVTLLHMLFEYLAFANDIKFWRGRKDFKGLSLRSIAVNCYFQTIIFLYLVDSNEASWTILLPSAFGVLAEYWKLAQCVVLTKNAPPSEKAPPTSGSKGGSGTVAVRQAEKGGFALGAFGYHLQFSDSYDKRTRKHDDLAVRWLTVIMIPILVGYSIYSAVYNEHKSWYSYLVNTQVQFIYFFGFVTMTPQIFINYKLKSVGQLPWRTFIYKALNTVIDDLFAFIIKMPWLHRIACFRDDVVFVILLYQRWVYPVDMNRMADDDGDANDDKDDTHDKSADGPAAEDKMEEEDVTAVKKKNQ